MGWTHSRTGARIMAEKALDTLVRQVANRLRCERYDELTDRQLLERFQEQHDDDAFAALVKRHQKRVQGALTRVLRDPADVEDAFQATFLILLRKAAPVQWQTGLGGWLYAV